MKGSISKEVLEEKVAEGLSIREMAVCFGLSYTAMRRRLQRIGIKTAYAAASRVCKYCGVKLSGSRQYFCSDACKQKFYYKNIPGRAEQKCHKQTESAIGRKLKLVRLLGGKCMVCGYDKNLAALTFHHRDISSKRFALSGRRMSTKSFSEIEEEAVKCDLLCANCHAELHNPQLNVSNIPVDTVNQMDGP